MSSISITRCYAVCWSKGDDSHCRKIKWWRLAFLKWSIKLSWKVFGLLKRVHRPIIPRRLENRGMIASYENICSFVSFFLFPPCYAQSINCSCSAIERSASVHYIWFPGQLFPGTPNAVSVFVFPDCFLASTMKHTDSTSLEFNYNLTLIYIRGYINKYIN